MTGDARERLDIVSREVLPEERLLRFVVAPDGGLTPDLAAKLPGRGMWVEATRQALETALKKGLFAKSAKRAVMAPPGLVNRIESLLAARCLAQLGLALRAGQLVVGFDQVRTLLKARRPAYMIEACDGAADGRMKLVRLAHAAWGGMPVAGAFTADALGEALGRGPVAHLAIEEGPAARRFAGEFARLSGFRPATPATWTDPSRDDPSDHGPKKSDLEADVSD
jgi:predicted RNA-binding protein YlxR (DUF448 family)